MIDNIDLLIKRLEAEQPNAVCELNFNTPYELLVAVILSAQCTDKRVNSVTKVLFEKYNTPEQFASLSVEELIPYIHSCGFYNNKAKSIISSARSIMDDFDGKVPDNIDDLMKLAGVGRKTANVVYAVAFGGQAIAVDTHVFRVSNRIGLAKADNVLDTEKQLMEAIPRDEWSKVHHLLIHHGRYMCTARAPKCNDCMISDMCETFNKSTNKRI